ncbi:MAG: hypothetical protein KBC95_00160 [Candidatus Peribacteraceae bacterium]|nr:hypothetical protein [Candidatus Peribacteraceae bacterium]
MDDTARRFSAEITATLPVGAAQGVARIGAHYYVYGDMGGKEGLIVECDEHAVPTGRQVRLPAPITHPTGLTHHDRYGTFLGNTVRQQGAIYRINLESALETGTLDGCILHKTEDDTAVNGCRPEFVTLSDTAYLATADYGDVSPTIRLLDPETMQSAVRTGADGIVRHTLPTAPFTQSLWWDGERLIAFRNITAGRGWAVDTIDLVAAIAKGNALDAARNVLPLTNELEDGFGLGDDRWIFVTSSRTNNIMIGRIE